MKRMPVGENRGMRRMVKGLNGGMRRMIDFDELYYLLNTPIDDLNGKKFERSFLKMVI